MTNHSATILEIVNHIIIKHPSLVSAIEIMGLDGIGAEKKDQFKKWEERKFAPPSPNFIKKECLMRNGFPESTWIETGTYLGETTEFISMNSRQVYSIEPEPLLFENAKKKLENIKNIEIINGTSEEVMPLLLSKISGNVNFWLDGHYSAGVTFKGEKDTPILDELNCIGENLARFGKVCIMIDDVRCFNPMIDEYSSYPALDVLVDWAKIHKLNWHIEHDIFVIKKY